MNGPAPYYCSYCKKSNHQEDILMVNESIKNGFCSKECIEKFYSFLIDYFDDWEKILRENFKIENESSLKMLGNPKYIDQLLENPDEIYCHESIVNEKFYALISKHQSANDYIFYSLVICFIYDKKISFVLLATHTQSLELVALFQTGVKIATEEILFPYQQLVEVEHSAQDIKEIIESKKSQILAMLIEKWSDDDIPFEKFSDYDDHLEKTFKMPDNIFSITDDENDKLYVYTRSIINLGKTCYYYVICYKTNDEWSIEEDSLIPVLFFPSNNKFILDDIKLVEQFDRNKIN